MSKPIYITDASALVDLANLSELAVNTKGETYYKLEFWLLKETPESRHFRILSEDDIPEDIKKALNKDDN